MSSLRVRHSIQYIQYLYDSREDRSKLENLIRAFRGIQALPPDDPKSFFYLAGLHGLPFRGPGVTDPDWYGGYCWHSTVLFPTWHRIHLLEFENALRSIPGCQDVTLPFWDELVPEIVYSEDPADPEKKEFWVPKILTSPTFELDGRNDNPLYSYKLQEALITNVTPDQSRSSKPKDYETVRYPFAGLVGTEEDKTESALHNRALDGKDTTRMLNDNIDAWLHVPAQAPNDDEGKPRPDTYTVEAKYRRCLVAPNYTAFSNMDSQTAWTGKHQKAAISLEEPHNSIHGAIGGYYQSGLRRNPEIIKGAYGDMGDNATAGFDPIFFFHHCFIDYTFSIWQRLHKLTKRGDLTIEKGYPGTILKYGQPPNFPRGTPIDMSTPLHPFKKPGTNVFYTSDDVTDLNELGIAYGIGSLDALFPKDFELASSEKSPFDIINPQLSDSTILAGSNPNDDNIFPQIKWVHNIRLTDYEGSFVVRLFAKGYDGKEYEVGRKFILSRWNIDACRNCKSHVELEAYFPIDARTLELLEGPAGATGQKAEIEWYVKIQTRDELLVPSPGGHEGHGGEISDEEGNRATFDGPIVGDLL